MNKDALVTKIITSLEADYSLLLQAAKAAHDAATHEENIPDDKYETLALEASYVAQGQASRAQEIKRAVQAFRGLLLQVFSDETPIRMSALVELEDSDEGHLRTVFLGPAAGGLRLHFDGREIMVISLASPLGQELIGKECGDLVELKSGTMREYEIISVS